MLHTSDWHLGASIEQVKCRAEHEKVLEWLGGELEARAIDVLVVSGDIFHYQSPGNRDEKQYYDFLVDCAGIETLRKVVIVAGNHDSPSGIDAPSNVLETLDVHVVGALPRDEEERTDECLVPIENDDGEVELVVAAVPYVQRARLGVSLEDEGEESLHRRFQDAFQQLYAELAVRAEAEWPDARLVGTGHLTVYGKNDKKEPGDYDTALHHTDQAPRGERDRNRQGSEQPSIGTIDAMDPGVFDARYDYLALGHIHRPMPVGGRRRVRYSGTPVALSLEEARVARQVVVVDFDEVDKDDASPSVEPTEVPKWRDKLELRGTMEELAEELAGLKQQHRYPPAIYLTVDVTAEELMADRLGPLQEVLDEAYEEEWRPIIVDLQERRTDRPESDDETAERRTLGTEDPMEVFAALYEREHQPGDQPPDDMIDAFREIAGDLIDTDEGEQ